MPVARGTNAIGTGSFVSVPGVKSRFDIGANLAVGLDPTGELVLCSASSFGYAFLGFTLSAATTGGSVSVISMRGSAVKPVVESGQSLIPGDKVFLSATPGQVTQTAPTGPGFISIQVGVAISTTQMVLVTDQRVTLLG